MYSTMAPGYHVVPLTVGTSSINGPSVMASINNIGRCFAGGKDDSRIQPFHFQRRYTEAVVFDNSFSMLGSGKRDAKVTSRSYCLMKSTGTLLS